MKRLGGIWSRLLSFENLLLAYRKARRGKRSRPGVAEFGLDSERELIALQRELDAGEYQPGVYRLFTIYDRKPHVIAAAPSRDRVVHHAVMNVIEPVLDRTFISDSYACRLGKGVHAAVDRYQAWSQSYRYVLKMDVQHYFPSIDHELLKTKLRRRIKDRHTIDLLDRIIDGSPVVDSDPNYFPGDDLFTSLERRRGIPIGNLTSQFFANFTWTISITSLSKLWISGRISDMWTIWLSSTTTREDLRKFAPQFALGWNAIGCGFIPTRRM